MITRAEREHGANRAQFEQIEGLEPGTMLAPDGRAVMWVDDQAWVLLPEVHAQRLAEAMDQAKQRDAALAAQQAAMAVSQPEQPAVCHALIDGQLCGGSLIKASVCPRGALGRYGVAATLTCDVCGHVSAVMRGDS